MSTVTWKYVKQLENPNDVRDFLSKYHIDLPEELVFCLMNYNGGRPSEKEFDTDVGKGYVFKSLLSFNKFDKESVYNFYPDMFAGKTLFPFAMDSSGNLICYDTLDRNYVLWKHETDTEEHVMNNLCF